MDRKEIAKILSDHFGVEAKYMGTPSFAYQITIAEGVTYTIDREGKITNSEGIELEIESILKCRAPEEFKEFSLPMDGHSGVTLRNLINLISSKQSIIKKVFNFNADIVNEEFIENINNERLVTIEDFKSKVQSIGIEKTPGIKFDFEKKNIYFDFIRTFEDTDAAIQFAKALNESAKRLKQSSPKATETDNEKFTFRTFLVRLGFVGDDYKKAREVLLKNLEGNGAFRKGKPETEQ